MNPDAKLPYPRIVMIQTTSRCNSACIMCPWPGVAKKLPQGTMDDGLFGRILVEIARHPEIELAMPYLMNEPLLDPDIVRRIDALKQAAPQATVYLLSNGAALDEKLADAILGSKLDWIGFSIHALRPETYRTITGRKDGDRIIRRVTDFVKKAREAGKHPKYVMVTFTRMRPHVSAEETKEALAYWRDLGVDPVDYQDGYISRAGNVEVFDTPAINRPCVIGCKTVWAYRIASILYNGDMVPCCMDWNREVIWGNLRDESIEAIWNGPRRRAFLHAIHSGRPLPPGFLCTRCEDAIPAARPAEGVAEDAEPDEAALMTELESLMDEPAPSTPPTGNLEDRIGNLADRLRKLGDRREAFLARQRKFSGTLPPKS